MRFNKLGIVLWYDTEFRNRLEIPPLPIMESVGYIEILKDRVVVLHLKTPDGNPSDGIHTTIPRKCVKSILWLETKWKRRGRGRR